ncbi:MAG: hypothetical protein ABIA59_11125 [Candidatus Latescibacterota bacterium]
MRFIQVLAVLSLFLPQTISADSIWKKARVTVETGAQIGGAFGVEGPTHSTYRGVTEIGVLFDKLPDKTRRNPVFGLVLYGAIGDEDFRIGIKPKLRYQFRPQWSTDVSAGLIFARMESGPYVSQTGLVGGVTLNYSSWLSFKGDVNVVTVEDRPRFVEGRQAGIIEGGREISVYGGASLRNRAGRMATIVGTASFLALMIIIMAEGGRS